jgi:hypothetical protein
MRLTVFIHRVAFITNLFFIICLWIQFKGNFIHNQSLESILIILGWIVAPFINIIAIVAWIPGWLTKKKMVPYWLLIANILFLIVQIYVHFLMPVYDTQLT